MEADGDIHIALQDANGDKVGTVSAEIPVGPKWCEIRQMVFGCTSFTSDAGGCDECWFAASHRLLQILFDCVIKPMF